MTSYQQTGRRVDLEKRVAAVEQEDVQLKKELVEMKGRIAALEARFGAPPPPPESQKKTDEEDFDLFGDEEEAEEIEKDVPEPKPAKTKKGPVVAKSTLILDVKPWDTETDMREVEQLVRGITVDGLLWGASKLVDVAFGIKKLQISCVVEDEKVGVDFLEESITAFADHVQSVDVAAFNKI
jgi:translation elongation factor EF-1beta